MSKKASNQNGDKLVVESDSGITNQTRNQRRALMASIVAAGAVGLPTQWKKPVIDHILLPAHAETSPGPASTFTTQVTTSFAVAQSATGVFTCSNDLIGTRVITSTGGNRGGDFNISYIVTDLIRQTCQNPVGGTTSNIISNNTFTISNTTTALPTLTSFSTSSNFSTNNITGTFTSTASMSGTTVVTSSA